jgi:hypothetical protein
LFEVRVTLPPILQALHPGLDVIQIENTTSISLPSYPKLETAEQRFKYSTRLFPKTPTSTSLTEQAIKFNINQVNTSPAVGGGPPIGQVPVWRLVKDWYDLSWNNETGQLSYKRTVKSDAVTIDVHDREGLVIRRVIWHNCFITGFAGWEDLDWTSNDIFELTGNFAVDWWEDYYY